MILLLFPAKTVAVYLSLLRGVLAKYLNYCTSLAYVFERVLRTGQVFALCKLIYQPLGFGRSKSTNIPKHMNLTDTNEYLSCLIISALFAPGMLRVFQYLTVKNRNIFRLTTKFYKTLYHKLIIRSLHFLYSHMYVYEKKRGSAQLIIWAKKESITNN